MALMTTRSAATDLAAWAAQLQPNDEDLALARRALVDTVAVSLAAREEPLLEIARALGPGGRLAVAAHVLDYDDLHLPSTSHISAVCVPATLAAAGDARAYLAGASVTARLGARLGWPHYHAGWHATCTAGAPAAAVAAGIAAGLDADGLARAMALAVPAAGGNQRAFGTHAKSLQVGFAVDAGLRAAALAEAGATADPQALDAWLTLVGGSGAEAAAAPDADASDTEAPDADAPDADAPAIPGGLAIKLYPCCYALQRPITAVRAAVAEHGPVVANTIAGVTVSAPEGTLHPLIHDRPTTGLQGKFSLQYAIAAALMDDAPGFYAFTDEAVRRPEAQALLAKVEVHPTPGGDDLLAGIFGIELRTTDGVRLGAEVELPPGAPGRPPTHHELSAKIADCAGELADTVAALGWEAAAREVPALMACGGTSPRPSG